jgi:hypothetical protein
MVEQLNAPETGSGPYAIEHGEDDGFYHLTLNGQRTGKSYPLGKTAYRTARKLNDEHKPAAFLEEEPATAPAKAPKVSKSNPKSPKGSKASKSNPKAPKPKAEEPKPAAVLEFATAEFKGTREQWLNAFTAKARPIFAKRGFPLPDKIRVSVGFMFRSPKAIGQCWAESASADGHREVFINPTQADSSRVADILTHELAHCLFGPEEKHGKNFKAAVTALGLEGNATATVAGDNWREWAFPILAKLGPIPHGALDPSASGVKKQTTRLLKAECEDCGFVFRATAKWLNGKALQCPDTECCGLVCVEGEDGGDEE